MKVLLLLRHARASSEVNLADLERPLNDAGRSAAQKVGEFLKTQQPIDLVISSSAVRAHETANLVMNSAELKCELMLDERIYEGSSSKLLEVISEIDDTQGTVLLVGHNPGMEGLVRLLSGQIRPMSPATLARLTFPATNWRQVHQTKGELDWVV